MTHLENYGHWGLRQDCPWALSLLPYLGSDETVPGPCHCTIFRLRRNYPWALSLPPYSNFFYLKDSLSSLLEITLFFCFPEILEIKLNGLHAWGKCSELQHTQPLKYTEF